jgi:hypothetical protein
LGINAFTKTGNTVTFTAAVAAPTPVQVTNTTIGGNQYRIINSGTYCRFLGYMVLMLLLRLPTSANVTSSGAAFPLLPGTDEILNFCAKRRTLQALARLNAVVYITPGDGVLSLIYKDILTWLISAQEQAVLALTAQSPKCKVMDQ